MTKVYYTDDCDKSILQNKVVAIIGFGAQGAAHAANLRDSGISLVLGLREKGNSWKKAKKEGFSVYPISDAVAQANIVMLLIPDEIQASVYNEEIAPNIQKEATIAFAHGFNIHYEYIKPADGISVIMIAPKAQGRAVRSEYIEGNGVPSLIAVKKDYLGGNAKKMALAYAEALGSGKVGIIETSFKNETEADLFGEQAVLCGGMMELVKVGFETLVESGCPPEIAYFECLHELKLVVDLLYEGGYEYMQETISNTAEYGAWLSGKKIVNEESRTNMRAVLKNIQSGMFADGFMKEAKKGYPNMIAHRQEISDSLIEITGRKIRSMINKSK